MISDFQTRADTDHYTHDKMEKAYQVLSNYDLDLICVVGDLADNGKKDQITIVSDIYDKYWKEKSIPMFYCMGNHDMDTDGSIDMYRTVFDDYNYKYDVGEFSSTGNRHAIVNGYHFLAVQVESYYTPDNSLTMGGQYSAETLAWLDETLESITRENPNQYVFIITHLPIYDTVYGSTRVTSEWTWYTKQLNSVLDKYPQAMTFGGHIHYTLDAETSIWQGNFTALGTSAVAYTCLEPGFVNENGGKGDVTMPDSTKLSQGYVLEVDKNGNVNIKRIDFTENATIKSDFTLKAPCEDKSHLDTYNFDRRKTLNVPPHWVTKDAQITLADRAILHSQKASLSFTTALDDDCVYYYKIEIYRNGIIDRVVKYVTDFYKATKVVTETESLTIPLDSVSTNAQYTIKLYAVDIWGAESEAQTINLKTQETDDSQLPSKLMDVIISNGNISDLAKNASFENKKAAISKETVSFDSKTYTVDTIKISEKNQAYIGKFDTIQSAYGANAKFSSGMSIELFFSDLDFNGSEKHYIMASRQKGGFGVYIENGKISFELFTTTNEYEVLTVTSKEIISDALTHIMCVYDANCKALRLYINGKLSDATNVFGQYICATGVLYNRFALGSNLRQSLNPADGASNLLLVDANMYSLPLTDNQVTIAYNDAVNSLK